MADARVLIVGDNPLARVGLAALLAGQAGVVVAGQTSSVNLTADVDLYNPDVLAWDLGWEPLPERLSDARDLNLPFLALLNDPSQATDAWSAGARGLLLHEADSDRLAAGLAAVAQGLIVIDPSLSTNVLAIGGSNSEGPTEALTSREMEVLQLLAEGLPNKSIARKLGITDHTVKFHVNAIMSKLGAQSRTEAVVRATRQGFIIL
jgi:DNA-binding NarL/FixJ family response regulator